MREGRIILPVFSNKGEDMDALHTKVQDALCAAFGGFTATQGNGGWFNPTTMQTQKENVVVYDVAAEEDDLSTYVLLDSVVDMILRESDQHSVYVRYPLGSVKIHTRNDAARQEAA